MPASKPVVHASNAEPEGYRYTTDHVLASLPEGVSIANRVFIVTGGNSGLGEETARALSTHGANVIVATRSESSGLAAIERIKKRRPQASLHWMNLDLSDLDTVQKFVEEFHKSGLPLHGLICNAGIMAHPYAKTKQGFESQFGTNHIGHFLLIKLLMDDLIKSGPRSRVIVVSSRGHRWSGVRYDDPGFDHGKAYDPWKGYGQSKTANILCARTFNEKYGDKGVEFFSLHPGMIGTNLSHGMTEDVKKEMLAMLPPGSEGMFSNDPPKWMKSVEQGAATQVWAATSPDLNGKGGAYLDDCHIAKPLTEEAEDVTGENGRRLYDMSMEAVSSYL